MLRVGGFSVLNTTSIDDIDEVTPKTWDAGPVIFTSKTDETNVMPAKKINKDKFQEKDVHFAVWDGQSNMVPADNSSQNYGEINRSSGRFHLNEQAWIICKPQFTRVRSEGFFKEKTHIETLF